MQRKGEGLGFLFVLFIFFSTRKVKIGPFHGALLWVVSLPQTNYQSPPPNIFHYLHMDAEQVISYISFLFR